MYEFILTELATGAELSELPGCSAKRFAVPLLSMGTGSGQVPLDHADADTLLECNNLLKVYEVNDNFLVDGDRTLLQVGRQISAEEVAGEGGGSVAFTSADAAWQAARRLVGKVGQVIDGVTMTSAGYSRGDALNRVDPGLVILAELLAAINAEDPCGLRLGNVEASVATYVSEWRYKPLLEAIGELAGVLDGFDWRVRPIEPEPSGGAVAWIGELDIVAAMGTYREDAALEYGEGLRNLKSYRRPVTIDATANQLFHLPPNFPDDAGAAVKTAKSDASVAERGLLESVVASDLSVDDLRQRLLQHHLDVRHGPRQTLTLEPVRDLGTRVPRLGRDFEVGDVLPFRAWVLRKDGELVTRADVDVRMYQAEVNVDPSGAGTPALTVNPTSS